MVTRAFGAFALSVFICSVLYPFMRVQLLGIVTFTGAPGPTTFWSFKTNSIFYRTPDNPGPPIITELWFWDCWNQYTTYRTKELGLGINNVLISMFGAQVLTLLLTASAILKLKTHLHLSAAIVNVFTIFCMWLASRAFITSNYMYAFEAGFWLTLASATLFLAAAILSW